MSILCRCPLKESRLYLRTSPRRKFVNLFVFKIVLLCTGENVFETFLLFFYFIFTYFFYRPIGIIVVVQVVLNAGDTRETVIGENV